jgi:apolipoprotein N-acyltransferase
MRSPAPHLRCAGAAALSAWLMRAVPDLQLPAQLLPLAFLPALVAPLGAGTSTWALSGAAFGLVYTGSVLFGLAKWGMLVASLFWLALALLFVASWTLAGVVAARVPARERPLVLPLVWGLACYVLDEWVHGTLLLCAPSAPHSAWLRGLAASVGCSLADALVLLCAALLVIAVRRGSWPRRALATAGLALVLLAPGGAPEQTAAAQAEFTVVQPAIHWRRLAAAVWSLDVRMEVEAQLDRLTREAVARGPGTIVWPENGNGLANHLLLRRTQRLGDLLTDRNDLLAGGPDFTTGGQHQAVLHLDRAGHRATAHKAELVPWIERDLRPGVPTVLATLAGPVGIAVCYDILFGRHARALADAGAQTIVVTTDDASFGASTLARWHWGYAVFHAAEVGRSLVYASNGGPSGAMDAVGGGAWQIVPDGVAAAAQVGVARSEAASPASRGGRHLAALAAALVLLALARSGRHATPRERSCGAPGWALWLALPVGAASIECHYTPRVLGVSPARWRDDVRERLAPPAAADFLGPLFRQSDERSCGAATLAFAMTMLGDQVFESDLAPALGPAGSEVSFAQLAAAARARGFTVEAYEAASLADLHLGVGEIAVVHLQRRHYVAVWGPRGDHVTLFDAAHGAMFDVAAAEIEADWTGRVMIVRLAPHPRAPRCEGP